MEESKEYCLKWNTFNHTIATSLNKAQKLNEFVDVTLSAEGRTIHAHKVILSACSPYFRDLFIETKFEKQYPILVIIRDVSYEELENIIEFMYHGEVCVAQDKLNSLLKAADALKVRGLTQCLNGESEKYSITAVGEDESKPMNHEPMQSQEINNAIAANNLLYFRSFLNNSLDHPSHKPLMRQSPHLNPKKRKLLNSPHARHNTSGHSSTPGNTPPSLINTPTPDSTPSSNKDKHLKTPPSLMQMPFNPMFSNSSQEDEDKVVNLSLNNNDHRSPCRMSKEEAEDDQMGGMLVQQDQGSEDDKPPPPLIIPDEDSKDRQDDDSPHNMSMSAARSSYGFYDALAGTSGVLTSPSHTWRGSVPSADHVDTGPSQPWRPSSSHPDPGVDVAGSHPVFNELFGEGTSCGGKKAVPTPCPVCQKVLSNPYNMRVHLETHEDTTYKCIICGIYTRTRDTMRKHCSNVHQLRNIELKQSFKKISGKGEPGLYLKPEKGAGKMKSLKSLNRFASLPTLLKPKPEIILTKSENTNENIEATKPSDRFFGINPLTTFPSLLQQQEALLGQTTMSDIKEEKPPIPPFNPITSFANLAAGIKQEVANIQSNAGETDPNLAKGSSLASIVNKLSQKQ